MSESESAPAILFQQVSYSVNKRKLLSPCTNNKKFIIENCNGIVKVFSSFIYFFFVINSPISRKESLLPSWVLLVQAKALFWMFLQNEKRLETSKEQFYTTEKKSKAHICQPTLQDM